MPRAARIKSGDGIYHVMIRSISEINLFNDHEDKRKYFSIIKDAQLRYYFAVYAYCLMDNHGHLILDPLGADISRVMHYINFRYAMYYNRKYKRHGHVFQDRFKSKIIDSDRYMITLSAHIHNNPKDIGKYKNNVLVYPFSSLKEYINGTNTFGILSLSFLESIIGFKNKKTRENYLKLVEISSNQEVEEDVRFFNEKTNYQSCRKIISRYHTANEIIGYVSKILKENKNNIYLKNNRSNVEFRAISCFLMNVFANMTQKEICEVIGGITQSGVSYLVMRGLEVIRRNEGILDKFIA